VILTSDCHARAEEAITAYFKRLRFDEASTTRARTCDLPDAKQEHYHEATAAGLHLFFNGKIFENLFKKPLTQEYVIIYLQGDLFQYQVAKVMVP
jgi:hypothetical protein